MPEDTFFPPLPQPSVGLNDLDLDGILQFVQQNLNTLLRSITFQGDLFSANWNGARPADLTAVDSAATLGFYLDASAGAIQAQQLFVNAAGGSLSIDSNANTVPGLSWDVGATSEASIIVGAEAMQFNSPGDSAGPQITLNNTPGNENVTLFASGGSFVVGGAGLRVHADSGVIKARAQDITGSTISTTETVELTATLAIPTAWNTYDIEAIAVAAYTESGTLTADRNVTTFLRIGSTVGTLMGSQVAQMDDVAPNRLNIPILGFATGQTTTGNVNVVLSSQISNDTTQVSIDDTTILATAYRLS